MDRLEEILKVLKATSDSGRARILLILNEKDLCVCEIREIIGLSQPTISSHLKILENAGLIQYSKDGKWVNYRLNSELGRDRKELLNNIINILKDSIEVKSDKKILKNVNRLEVKK